MKCGSIAQLLNNLFFSHFSSQWNFKSLLKVMWKHLDFIKDSTTPNCTSPQTLQSADTAVSTSCLATRAIVFHTTEHFLPHYYTAVWFYLFFSVWAAFFLNKLTTDQLNIMQVSTLSNSLQCQNSQVMHLAITWVRILQIFLLGNNYIPILSKIKHFRLYSTAEWFKLFLKLKFMTDYNATRSLMQFN